MAILKKQILIDYLITKHKEKFSNSKITPIKVQKGLYFLYAFWGGKIKAQNLLNDSNEEMTEMKFSYDEDLFEASFEAWAYGPIDREVYAWFKKLSDSEYDSINHPTLENVDKMIVDYIDDLINKILNTNDFVLVDLSHKDKCWYSVYTPNRKNAMNNEEIKLEYAS